VSISCTVCGSGGANVGDGAVLENSVDVGDTVSDELEILVEGAGEAGDERAEVEEEETGDVDEPSS
jgi:hypothetical protein